MKLLLILFTAIFLTSCKTWKEAGEARDTFITSLEIGDEWDKYPEYHLTLKEANEEYTKYFIEGIQGCYYITVKNNHIVSIWVKPKPY
jgi:hypothetical protein